MGFRFRRNCLVQQLDRADCQAVNYRLYRTSRSEGASTEGASTDAWNSQLMATGGSQVPATSNVGPWDAVSEVRRCLIPETPVNGHGNLVLHSLRDIKPVQLVVKQC